MRGTAAVGTLVVALLLPASASAHGVAQRADLPIPEWLFVWGAVLVLVASFVALASLWPQSVLEQVRERRLFRVPLALEILAGSLGVAAFLITVWAGFAGNQTATANLAPTVIYVIFWVGVPFASVLLGDVFAAFNPWRAVGRATGWAARRVAGDGVPQPLAYPEWLGRWPAAAGLLAFAWVEIVFANRDDPSVLAVLTLAYAAVMLVGMSLYGVDEWTRRADGFSVWFGLVARLSPLHWRGHVLCLRPPLSGAPRMWSGAGSVAVVCVMIGTTSFDGITQGSLWTGASGIAEHLTDAFASLALGREAAVQAAYTVGLLAMVALVSGLYRLAVGGMHRVGGGASTSELARRFAHSLVPIAFAYLVAHYFSLLAFQGQAIAYLASDPLGECSDLLGTASATINYGLLSATGIWYVQVAALVLGHFCALVLAHDRALATWRDKRAATRSQYWMLLVMVAFTSLGLWLLSSAAR